MHRPLQLSLWILPLVLSMAAPVAGRIGSPPLLDRSAFEARGRNEAVLTVGAAGRYSIQARSATGTALELIDRAVGPRMSAGTAGQHDGRIDAFLDAGEYKVVATSPDNGGGALALAAHAFAEGNAAPPVLGELAVERGSLSDHQQLSYWLHVEAAGPVHLEAQGRSLADLRIWRDGEWMVDAVAVLREVAPVPGCLEGNARIVVKLPAGWYRVTAYGRAPRAWASGGKEEPFRIRRGLRRLADVARVRGRIGAFGSEHLVVPAGATQFRLGSASGERPALRLDVRGFEDHDAVSWDGSSDSIAPTGKATAAQVHLSHRKRATLVTVTGAPGTPYLLEYFEPKPSPVSLGRKPGRYAIATVNAADRADRIDATGILTERSHGQTRAVVLAADVIHVGDDRPWARRFNLLVAERLFVFVENPGEYVVRAEGPDALFKLEPFLTSRPEGYESPEAKPAGERWKLDRGHWVLTITPKRKGILTAALGRATELAGAMPALQQAKVQCQLPEVQVREKHDYQLHLNDRAGELSGVLIRPAGAGAPDATELGEPAPAPASSAPPAAGATIVKLPVVKEGAPLHFDLERDDEKSALLSVAGPGLYRIETTGLLQTELVIRTQVTTRLWSDRGGGPGRNALLMPYLRAGEYHVAVRSLGKSAGRCGLTMARTPLEQGGELRPGRPMRASVKAFAAVAYPVKVPRAGVWKLETLGTGKPFECRFEDRDGWPLVPANAEAKVSAQLAAGDYRYLTLPRDVDSLRVTRLELEPVEREISGRGPHALALDETVQNVWHDPPAGEPARDAYDVTVPATIDAKITLSDPRMQGQLRKRGDPQAPPVALVRPGSGWEGQLAPGDYRLEVACRRPEDGIEYSTTVSAKQLTAGAARDLAVPCEVGVRVDRTGVIELASQGTLDVRATLVRVPDGGVVDASDDAENDWNFRIARTLAPGAYTLKLSSAAGEGQTRVTMTAPAERTAAELRVPARQRLELGGAICVLPLAIAGEGVLSVRADSAGLAGCALEAHDGRVLALRTGRRCAIDLRIQRGERYRLRLWSIDRQSDTVDLAVARTDPPRFEISRLEAPVTPPDATVPGERTSLAFVHVDRPGVFRPHPAAGFAVATEDGAPLEAVAGDTVALAEGRVAVQFGPAGKVRLERLAASPGAPVTVPVKPSLPRVVDVAVPRGALPILVAEADAGEPGCAFVTASGNPVHGRSHALADRACVAVGPVDATRALVWSGARSAGAPYPIRVRVEPIVLPDAQPLPPGDATQEIPPRGSVVLALPAGAHRVDVSLERGLIAFPLDGSTPGELVAARDAAVSRSVETSAARLAIVDLGGAGGRAGVALTKLAALARPRTLGTAAPFEELFAGPATFRIDLDRTIPPGATLHAAGAACAYTGDDGVVATGPVHAVAGAPGHATLTAGPGLVKLWVASAADPHASRYGPLPAGPWAPAEPNSEHPLSGATMLFELTVPAEGALHVETDRASALCLISPDGTMIAAGEGLSGSRLDRIVGPGRVRIGVRGVAGGALAGRIRFGLAPVTGLGEGVGPELLIAGGQVRTFSFTVREKRAVGLGIKATRDALACTLSSPDDAVLGRGAQQFAELAPGTYILRVSLPAGEEPVRFRPAVFGVDPPGKAPPEDAIRTFLGTIGSDAEEN